jgi:hypothetical protein
VVALVHDDVAVVLDKDIDLALAGQRLHHRDVDLTGGLCLAAADGANHVPADADESP